LIENH
jgi:hypothetical protein